MRNLHQPGVTCAPDDFDSFEAMGVTPAPRLQPLKRVPWTGVERRRSERIGVSTHGAQCHDMSLTNLSPKGGESGDCPATEGVC